MIDLMAEGGFALSEMLVGLMDGLATTIAELLVQGLVFIGEAAWCLLEGFLSSLEYFFWSQPGEDRGHHRGYP